MINRIIMIDQIVLHYLTLVKSLGHWKGWMGGGCLPVRPFQLQTIYMLYVSGTFRYRH